AADGTHPAAKARSVPYIAIGADESLRHQMGADPRRCLDEYAGRLLRPRLRIDENLEVPLPVMHALPLSARDLSRKGLSLAKQPIPPRAAGLLQAAGDALALRIERKGLFEAAYGMPGRSVSKMAFGKAAKRVGLVRH